MSDFEFRVNFNLSKELISNVDTLGNDFFQAGIEQINWFQIKIKNKKDVLNNFDLAYIASNDYSKKVLTYAERSTKIEEKENCINFSFAIKNSEKNFSEINENGKRPWLRQYLDDHILHYSLNALLEKSFNFDNDLDRNACEKFKNMHIAFRNALNNAFSVSSETFWIEGEFFNNDLIKNDKVERKIKSC